MAVASIPAAAIVSVTPSVIGAGGSGLDLSGLILTPSTRVPIGSVLTFGSAADVATYFGGISNEALAATVYFQGYVGSSIKPAALLFAQYPATAVPAYLRGGSLSSLVTVQGLTGTIAIVINGASFTSGSINLSGAASFSAAAATIQTALGASDASVTGSIAGSTLTVSSVARGVLAVGQIISGSGITPGTTITALGTGTGGVGTYTVSTAQTAAGTTIVAGPVTVTYDSIANAFVITDGTPGTSTIAFPTTNALTTGLGLTQATGAVISAGAPAGVPATFMAGIVAQTQNFVSFTTLTEPSTADCLAFAAWTNAQGNSYAYMLLDSDIVATQTGDTTSALYQLGQSAYSGTAYIYEPTAQYTNVFAMGAIASFDYTRLNGRATLAFKSSGSLFPSVTNKSIGDILIAKGGNFYGGYATRNDRFVFFYPGQISGPFDWIDSYVDQIQLNNACQLALMELLTSIGSIPYTEAGYALIEAALSDPIGDAVDYGSIRAGVALSELQAAEVNAAVGLPVSDTITARGWYLQVADPGAQVRGNRGSPICTLFYADGQAVQSIALFSVEVE